MYQRMYFSAIINSSYIMWRFHFVLRHTILFCSMFVPAHTHHCIKVQLSIEFHRLISVFPIINPHKCMTSEDTDQNSVPNFFLEFDFIKLNVELKYIHCSVLKCSCLS